MLAREEYLFRTVISADAVDDGNGTPISAHPQVLFPDGKTAASSVRVHVGHLDLRRRRKRRRRLTGS